MADFWFSIFDFKLFCASLALVSHFPLISPYNPTHLMLSAPIPKNEQERLKSLKKMGILDMAPEPRFDRFTKQATELLHMPISTISIIDSDREWYKSCHGMKEREGKRDVSFCGHAMLQHEIFIVENTLNDECLKDNLMVTGPPHIRFYAGVSLHNAEGFPVGVLCVKDVVPRRFTMSDQTVLIDLAAKVEKELLLPANRNYIKN